MLRCIFVSLPLIKLFVQCSSFLWKSAQIGMQARHSLLYYKLEACNVNLIVASFMATPKISCTGTITITIVQIVVSNLTASTMLTVSWRILYTFSHWHAIYHNTYLNLCSFSNWTVKWRICLGCLIIWRWWWKCWSDLLSISPMWTTCI